MKQAEDRVNRIGQKSNTVLSTWITGGEYFSVDDKLDKLLQEKDTHCEIVLNQSSENECGGGNRQSKPGSTLVFQSNSSNSHAKNTIPNSNTDSKVIPKNMTINKANIPISSYFQSNTNTNTNITTGTNPNTDPNSNTNSNTDWNINVTECEEETVQKSNNIMKDLLRSSIN